MMARPRGRVWQRWQALVWDLGFPGEPVGAQARVWQRPTSLPGPLFLLLLPCCYPMGQAPSLSSG